MGGVPVTNLGQVGDAAVLSVMSPGVDLQNSMFSTLSKEGQDNKFKIDIKGPNMTSNCTKVKISKKWFSKGSLSEWAVSRQTDCYLCSFQNVLW